jgi:hypothetical protein
MQNRIDVRRLASVLATVALALVAARGGLAADDRPSEIPYSSPGAVPSLSPEYKLTSHKVVLITDNAINPRLVTLDEGQLVAWISYSPVPSVVVFEREVARNMICHSLVNFSIKDDELRSAPINAGEFASFCQLKPGRYKYTVVRPDRGGSGTDAQRRLEGEIIVGNPTGAPLPPG